MALAGQSKEEQFRSTASTQQVIKSALLEVAVYSVFSFFNYCRTTLGRGKWLTVHILHSKNARRSVFTTESMYYVLQTLKVLHTHYFHAGNAST